MFERRVLLRSGLIRSALLKMWSNWLSDFFRPSRTKRTTRSRIAGIERTRTFLPPSFGISFFRAGMGRYVLLTNSSRICFRKLSTPLSSTASNVTPSTPGAPSLLFAVS